MPETASTLATWRIGGQIDESALTGISQYADITVVASLVGATGQNVVDPTNEAHVLRGPYTTVVGGTAGTATTHPTADGNATLAGRLWWTEPLKATGAADPNAALQPSGLAWQIVVTSTSRRGDSHTLATFTVGVEGDRDYDTGLETILVPSGTGGADESAINVTSLVEPPATVADNTFAGRVASAVSANGQGVPVGGTISQALVKNSATDYDTEWADVTYGTGAPVNAVDDFGLSTSNSAAANTAALQAMFDYLVANPGTAVIPSSGATNYAVTGAVTIADGLSALGGDFGFYIDARGARFSHAGGGPFITTRAFTNLTDAANTTARRTRRKWRGGYFSGDSTAGSTCFKLSSWNFATLDDVTITGFSRGVDMEFCLNSLVERSTIFATEHNVRVSSMVGSVTGATAFNSASNMTRVEGVRMLGATAVSRILVKDSGGVVIRDCTSEGNSVPIHVDIESANTSAMSVVIDNLWVESNATTAVVRSSFIHQVKVGFGHLVNAGLGPAIQSLGTGAIIVTDMPNLGGGPLFERANTTEEWRFYNMGGGRFDARNAAYWVGGLVGEVAYVGTDANGDPTIQIGDAERIVTGSRASGAALTDLLNQLSYMGIITNSSSA